MDSFHALVESVACWVVGKKSRQALFEPVAQRQTLQVAGYLDDLVELLVG